MSKVVTTTVLPDVDGTSLTIGAAGDNVVVTGNDLRTNVLQDAGGNAVFTSNGSGVMSGMNSVFGGALNLLSTQTARESSSVSFTTQLTSTYDVYCFKYFDVHPATDDVNLQVQFSSDGGSSYGMTKTTTFFYAYNGETAAPALSYQTSRDLAQSTSAQQIASLIGNDADACAAGEFWLFAPSSTTYVKHFYGTYNGYETSTPYSINGYVAGYVNSTSAVNAAQFTMSSGNIDAGTIKLYGISKT